MNILLSKKLYMWFQARYTSGPKDAPRAQVAYFEVATKLYKGMMKRARDIALEHLDTSDLTDCIEGNRPTWIPPAIWEWLIRYHWVTNKFKLLSEKNNKNWLTKKDGDVTRHVG